jgi:short-subunit dehydrogenase
MKDLAGKTAVVTGASRGIGVDVARALHGQGMNILIAARTAAALDALRAELDGPTGPRVIVVPTDVSKDGDLQRLVETAERECGGVDVLVNNAGIESVYTYHKLGLPEIDEVIAVNLVGPMHLAWMVLPGMLRRGSGHIVNMSSLAGKAGPAYAEPYAATKAGLIGFTQSLRATYRPLGVSASVICPGFVDAGMYARGREEQGGVRPRSGVASARQVAEAVVRAIRQDLPEVTVNPVPVRPLLAANALAPGLAERLSRLVDANDLFRRQAELRERQRGA